MTIEIKLDFAKSYIIYRLRPKPWFRKAEKTLLKLILWFKIVLNHRTEPTRCIRWFASLAITALLVVVCLKYLLFCVPLSSQ